MWWKWSQLSQQTVILVNCKARNVMGVTYDDPYALTRTEIEDGRLINGIWSIVRHDELDAARAQELTELQQRARGTEGLGDWETGGESGTKGKPTRRLRAVGVYLY
jgi:hypothetical protein